MSRSRTGLGRNLTAGVVEHIGLAIAGRDYDDIRFPTEGLLAERYAVSRAVIREAMKILTAKGLIGARPGQGTFVCTKNEWNLLDPDVIGWALKRGGKDMLLHYSRMRLAIEPEAAALMASRGEVAALREAEQAFTEMMMAQANERGGSTAEIRFLGSILWGTQNMFFANLRRSQSLVLERTIRLVESVPESNLTEKQGLALMTALRKRDAQCARDVMRGYLDRHLGALTSVCR